MLLSTSLWKTLPTIVLAVLIAINTAPAQQNNFSEDYSAYLPEIRAYNQTLRPMPDIPLTPALIQLVRQAMQKPVKTVLQPTVRSIPGPHGDIGLRIFRPDTVEAVLMYIHGGGHVWGNAASEDSLNDITARFCRMAVVSVEYHLAPEYPFPAQTEDCYTVAKWLVKNAAAEFGADQLFLSGGSAGAHLAALTTLYIRDSLQAIDRVRGVNLQYGLYDLGRTPSHRQATDATLGINKHLLDEIMRVVFSRFSPEELWDPRFSPLYADLTHLPPAMFTIGTEDPLLDDTCFMEARWRSAGNTTYLAVYPECVHGFNVVPSGIGRLANEKMNRWMQGLIGR